MPWLDLRGADGREELGEIYKESSVLIHPVKYDPFPSVIFEAANFEIPSAASLICGIPEMICDTQTGYVVDPGDHNLFADCVIDLVKDNDHCREMGEAAKAYVRDRFYPVRIALNMQKAIEGSS